MPSTILPGVRDLWLRVLDRFFPYGHIFNAWRRANPSQPRLLRWLLLPITRIGLLAGFRNIEYSLVNGSRRRLHIGERCSTLNTVFNVVSGDIWVGDDTVFSHDCHVLTGIHQFHNGQRASLDPDSPIPEVPSEGRSVHIGRGCFFGACAVVIGPVTIGDNVIIGAGSVVTKDVPSGSFVAGVPARVIGPS